jgi:hypothetical protein
MPTEVVSTVIPGGGGDYSLLASWESGSQGNFVAADEIDVAACHTGTTSESFFVGGSTTDATRYREIRAAAGHEHGGNFSAGFRISSSSTTDGPIRPFDDHLHIRGIVIKKGSMTSGSLLVLAAPGVWCDSCLLDCGSVTQGVACVSAVTGYIWNNIIIGIGTSSLFAGIRTASSASAEVYAYNNTVIGGDRGINQFDGTLHVKNNICQGQATSCFAGTLSSTAGNISSDATSPETGLRNISLTFANAGGNDYHLAAGDAAAIGAGTDLSADAILPFNYDIDGNARPQGSAWDIGADEFVSALLAEDLAANTVLATSNLRDTSSNIPPANTTDIDEDPASPDGNWWTAVNVGLATDARVGFPTPSTGTPKDVQTFYIWARKTTGTQHPTVDVELWEAGVFVATLLDNVSITSTTGQLLTATFNTAGSPPSLTNPADVEIRIVSTPGVAA